MSARAKRELLTVELTGKGFAAERVAMEVMRAAMNFMIATNGLYVLGCCRDVLLIEYRQQHDRSAL
jgi:hypothetical protein